MSKRGVKRNETASAYVEFGRYLLYTPSLELNVLKVVYPKSRVPVPSLHNYSLSPALSTLLTQLVDRGVLSETQLAQLSKPELSLLRKICKTCQIEKSVLLPDDEQEKKDIARFNILRGEVAAGNDSREILKELKQYIIRFSASGLISRSKATELLLHITCVELGC